MKTAELEGVALDYWVARCERLRIGRLEEEPESLAVMVGGFLKIIRCKSSIMLLRHGSYLPSHDWACGGPIIQRERICIGYSELHCWGADFQDDVPYRWHGKTPLIAAMRAFVASKFGDEVEDIKEPS